MKTYKTRAELKFEVKNLLKGHWKQAILLYLIPLIIYLGNMYSSRSQVRTNFFNGSNYFFETVTDSVIKPGIIGFIVTLVFLIINLSANFRSLDWLEDPQLTFDPLKSNFTYFRNPDWWKLTLLYILISIFTFLWSLLLIIPGIVKGLAYSQTYFVYKDFNDRGLADNYSLTDYINKSQELMIGNKWRFFVLQLSFLGWLIVGAITFGIGYIWILPYYKITLANFYRDLVEKKSISNIN
ncbi:DUF975 family protein [Companilactobacillus sp. FL22-1]|uniref:DUF975 family protein n=1 Tax=Companilactobacillus sp. FL22-1 TaxID=3373892 RepID=UPI0037543F08